MKYIFLIGAFNSIFFAFLVMHKKPKALHDRILIVWLMFLGLFTATYSFSDNNLFEREPLLTTGIISLFMLHGPFLYLYISALVLKKTSLTRADVLHFVPFALFIGYLFVASLFPEYSERIRMDHVLRETHIPSVFVVFLILTALSGPAYFILSIALFKKLDINIFNNFSYSDKIDLDWLRKLVYIFGIIWTALMIIAVIHHLFHLFSIVFCTDGLFLSLTLFIMLIGYYGLRQKEIFINSPVQNTQPIGAAKIKYAGSTLKESDTGLYIQKIKGYMENKKPYLDPDLTLSQLAADLDIPVHHLSQIINENFGSNFFDFVNHYRVLEVKKKIGESYYSNYSLLGIAYESGFNSKSAFNRVFKKLTGLSPSEYKNQV